MKQVSLKKLYQLQGKLTESRVLQGRAGLRGVPRGGDGVRKFSPSCGTGRGGIGQDKTMQGKNKDPILRSRLAPLPSSLTHSKFHILFAKFLLTFLPSKISFHLTKFGQFSLHLGKKKQQGKVGRKSTSNSVLDSREIIQSP